MRCMAPTIESLRRGYLKPMTVPIAGLTSITEGCTQTSPYQFSAARREVRETGDPVLCKNSALWCLRCLLLVMCTHPFAREALTLHLARREGHERYFDCNLIHRRVLASSHQHLMAEAPNIRRR